MKRIIVVYASLLMLAVGAVLGRDLEAPEEVAPQALTYAAPATFGLVTEDEAAGGLLGRPFDPQTLADLPGYEPIAFQHHYTTATSPDGETMALITWPGGMSVSGKLRLVDRRTWTVRPTSATFNDYVSLLHFGPDGSTLYWVQATHRDPAHGIPREHALYRYDLGSDQVTAVTQLPPTFIPWEMQPLGTGDRLALYGIPTDTNNLTEAPAHVLLADLATADIVVDVSLDGVTAGQRRIERADGNTLYHIYRPALAWDTARSRLYVVHPDEDSVTVVDLEGAKARRWTVAHGRPSAFERLLGWGARTAEAKMVGGSDRQAALSPDGRRLYVTGIHREMVPTAGADGWTFHETPLGLQVIATEDLTEVQRLDLPVTNLMLSPDGKWLLLTGSYDITAANGSIERVEHGLYLVDAATLEVKAHLLTGSGVNLEWFAPDGRHAYVRTWHSQWLGDHYGNWRSTLYLLDPQTGQFVAERELPGGFLDMVP